MQKKLQMRLRLQKKIFYWSHNLVEMKVKAYILFTMVLSTFLMIRVDSQKFFVSKENYSFLVLLLLNFHQPVSSNSILCSFTANVALATQKKFLCNIYRYSTLWSINIFLLTILRNMKCILASCKMRAISG